MKKPNLNNYSWYKYWQEKRYRMEALALLSAQDLEKKKKKKKKQGLPARLFLDSETWGGSYLLGEWLYFSVLQSKMS